MHLACIVASICFLQERFMHEKPGCILTASRIRNSFMAKSHGYKHGHAPPVRAAFANYSLHRAALTQQTYVLALHTISLSSSSAGEGMFWVLSVVCVECCYYHCCHSSRENCNFTNALPANSHTCHSHLPGINYHLANTP